MVLFVGAESNTKNNNKVACSQEKSCVSCEKEKEFFFYYAGLAGIKLSDSSAKRTFTKYTNRMREISNLLNCPNIAYMKLNKTGGGSSTTPKALLSSLKGNTSDYIKEQLEVEKTS